jgi:hypothetical protein
MTRSTITGSTGPGIRPDVLLAVDGTLLHVNYHCRKPDMIMINTVCSARPSIVVIGHSKRPIPAVATVQM